MASFIAAPPTLPETVIGVNRAAILFPCTVWACCDLPAIEQWHEQVLGTPLLIAGMEAIDNLRDRKRANGEAGEFWRGRQFDRRVMLDCPHVLDWVMFSATTALVYAGYIGATEIDVYGADWAPDAPDCDGVAAGKNRSAARFELEAAIWTNRIVPWLSERGVRVTRHVTA